MALIECKNCGNQVSDKAEKCPHCGMELTDEIYICEECGAEVEKGLSACPKCGCPIGDVVGLKQNDSDNISTEIKKNGKKKLIIIAVVVAIVVLCGIVILGNGGDESNDMEPTESNEAVENNSTVDSKMSAADIYKTIADNSGDLGMEFSISEDSINFINEHPEFFPGNDDNSGAMSDFVDYDIEYRHLDKKIEDYDDKLVSVYGEVIDIQEMEEGDTTLTYVHVLDSNFENYVFIYIGELGNVYKENYINAYLLPLDMVSFENKKTEYTDAAFCAGAYVYNCGDDEYAEEDYCI